MTSVDSPPFGALLRQLRRSASLTQEELAERAGVSVETVSGLERGTNHSPYRSTVVSLADALRLEGEERALLLAASRRRDEPPLVRHPNNLPDEPTPFIGREGEVRAVRELMDQPGVRLVTLTGTGGTGKTRLAIRVASAVLSDYQDGVFFVNLAPLSDPALVPSAIAQVLDVKEGAGKDLRATLADYLEDKHLLLVLDNFEHLLDAYPVVASLLDECRQLHVLVTSRTPLRLRREHTHTVPPLSVPDLANLPNLEQLSRSESVALFVERAIAAQDSFRLTEENAPAVVEICSRLDGLPLAIELAAARTRLLPPHALLHRLSSRSALLTEGARDAPARHQTLHAAIDWSYSLLSLQEQMLFARLSVFTGGCTVEAAETVCRAGGEPDLLDGIASLVEKNLAGHEGAAKQRFVMLETVREYAREKLDERGETERTREVHARYFLALAEHLWHPIVGRWSRDADPYYLMPQLETDIANFREALRWAMDGGRAELGIRLAGALSRFWYGYGSYGEGRRWLNAVLARRPGVALEHQLLALDGAAQLAERQGDFEEAAAWNQEYLSAAQQIGHQAAIARGLETLAGLANHHGDPDRGAALREQALKLWRASGELWQIGFALSNLGLDYHHQRDYQRAVELYEESQAIYQQLGEDIGQAVNLHRLGYISLMQGRVEQAAEQLRESLRMYRALGNPTFVTSMLEGLAWVAGVQGRVERAARLLGAADSIQRHFDIPQPPPPTVYSEGMVAAARAQTDEATWKRAWEQGGAMTLVQAIAYALNDVSSSRAEAGASCSVAGSASSERSMR